MVFIRCYHLSFQPLVRSLGAEHLNQPSIFPQVVSRVTEASFERRRPLRGQANETLETAGIRSQAQQPCDTADWRSVLLQGRSVHQRQASVPSSFLQTPTLPSRRDRDEEWLAWGGFV